MYNRTFELHWSKDLEELHRKNAFPDPPQSSLPRGLTLPLLCGRGSLDHRISALLTR